MYKPSIYLEVAYFLTYLPMYKTFLQNWLPRWNLFSYRIGYQDETNFLTELVTKIKSNINSIEVHPQLSNKRHPVDGALVGAGLLWQMFTTFHIITEV
jgi:hypothetical protein